MDNTIYLRRANKLIIESNEGKQQLPKTHLATALKNIEALGYTFSDELMQAMRQLSMEQFEAVYHQLVADLRVMVGAHVKYTPMYAGFPMQVMQADEAELYLNAIIHYLTNLTVVYSDQPSVERMPLLEKTDLKVIGLGNKQAFQALIRQIIEAKGSISETDKADIDTVLEHADPEDVDALLPAEIPFKENVGFVVASLLKHEKANIDRIGPYFKTASDVLRLAVAWSNGDVSLAAASPFRKFKRRERRLLLGLLEQCGSITEDMLRYKDRWIRLGEILHPSEYKLRYPRCEEAFDILRNNKPYSTFNGSVELAFQYRNVWSLIDLLSQRPGEFARRLDHMLRMTEDEAYVLLAFGEVLEQVSTPVLLQVRQHFAQRNERQDLRVFFPKGNVAKAFAVPNELPEIDEGTCQDVVQLCEQALVERFANLSPLGKTYVDPQLHDYLVPFSQRSASKALHTIVRGSRVPMAEGDTIRFFNWWKEGDVDGKSTGRVDIDLSAVMYDKDWNYVEHISYTNLRSSNYKAVHSGDIVTAPNGASEFIDLHIPSIVAFGGRYVVATLLSFTSHPYCDLPECFVGWMMRKKPGSGEIFEPSTVANKIDITADTQIAIPVIMDLVERTVIWTDLALTRYPDYHNNVEGNQKGIVLMGKALTTLRKPDLHDLFMLHAKARGELVDTIDQADTIYSVDQGVTPYDIEQIMAEYLV
ncbi:MULTISPECIES: TerD family protein [unclassified Paenibacillus]|uniref:TerD family protein n=1 Tax=unclassified Paenibacillus TaxID=185978 RepID=UPI0015E3990B|nr:MULTISPECIES: TerD family protein [unclassified Paenibacillus]QZN77013.1 TerD family protein [Paenibacillus sp. DR312]